MKITYTELEKLASNKKNQTTIIDGEEWEVVDSIKDDGHEYMEIEGRVPYDSTINAIERLIKAGITTNIHYVLGNNSIDEAISRIQNNTFPKGINAVIFLLHKPVGLGQQDNVLKPDDPKVKEFFNLVDSGLKDSPFKIGFDSCSIPGIINYTNQISKESIDTCEGGRFSAYISSDMIALPCSFDQDHKWGFDIKEKSFAEAWKSPQFNNFRDSMFLSCSSCKDRLDCMGGCPIKREVVLCDREEREIPDDESISIFKKYRKLKEHEEKSMTCDGTCDKCDCK